MTTLIGLTGGIGGGKSFVASTLRGYGYTVIDADQLARDAVAPGTPAYSAIRTRFGDTAVTSPPHALAPLDRKKLAAIVFADPAARADLNAIVHPEVARLAQAAFAAAAARDEPLVFYEVPLLFENRLDAMFAETWHVAAPDDIRIARVVARDNTTEADARARIAAQLPETEKIARATVVIDNAPAPTSASTPDDPLAPAWQLAFNTEKQLRLALLRAQRNYNLPIGVPLSSLHLPDDAIPLVAAHRVRVKAVYRFDPEAVALLRAIPIDQEPSSRGITLTLACAAVPHAHDLAAVEKRLNLNIDALVTLPHATMRDLATFFFAARNRYRPIVTPTV